MFAIIAIGGKQYKVSPGDVIDVDKAEGKVGDTITVPNVLLVEENGKTKVGTPNVSGTSVKAKIVNQMKGDKVEVFRYKSKVRYRKHRGFRAQLTRLEIVSIG